MFVFVENIWIIFCTKIKFPKSQIIINGLGNKKIKKKSSIISTLQWESFNTAFVSSILKSNSYKLHYRVQTFQIAPTFHTTSPIHISDNKTSKKFCYCTI